MKNRNGLYLLIMLVVALFAYSATAAVGDFMYPKIIEALGNGIKSLLNPTSAVGAVKSINISGTAFNLTIVTKNNGTHGALISNISLMWYPAQNGSAAADLGGSGVVLNMSYHNASGSGCTITASGGWGCENKTFWNKTLDTTTLLDGVYNLTILVYNFSSSVLPTLTGINHTLNSTISVNITVDNTPPNVTSVSLNLTNGTNLSVAGGVYTFNVTVNDTTTYTQDVRLGFTQDRGVNSNGVIGNVSEFNVTLSPGSGSNGGFGASLPFSTLTDGFYTVRVYANDSLGNLNKTRNNITFTLDTTPPNVTFFTFNLTNGTNFSSAAGVYVFNATINDTTTATKSVIFGFNVDNGLTDDNVIGNVSQFNVSAALAGANYSAVVPFSTLRDGRYTVKVYATDTVDNMNNSVNTVGFTIDTTPPNVTFFTFNLSNGTNLSSSQLGVYGFNATINDTTTSVKSVIFGFNVNPGLNSTGGIGNNSQFNVSASLAGANYSAVVPFSTLKDGRYTVKVYANDTVDNMNSSADAVVGFTIDTTAPNVTFITMNLTNGTNLSVAGGVYTFNVTANDTTTYVQEVRLGFTVDKGLTNDGVIGNVSQFNVTPSPGSGSNGGFGVSLPFSTLRDGFYSVRIYANDSVNNLNNSISNISFTIDTTPPNVTFFTFNLTNGTNFSSAAGVYVFNATINDTTTATKSVIFGFNVDRGLTNDNTLGNVSQFNVSAALAGANYSAVVPFSTLKDGRYTVKVYADDTVDNRNSSVNTIGFTIDTTPPNVTFFTLNLTNGTNLSSATGVYGFNATINDTTTAVKSVIFGFNVDRGLTDDNTIGNVSQFNVSASLAGANYSAVVPFSTLRDGRYTVRVYANDTLNNMNNSENIVGFTIDTTPPNVTTVSLGNFTSGINLSSGLASPTNNIITNITAIINDTTTFTQRVIFNISNSSGIVYKFNGSINGSFWNSSVKLNLSDLADGIYNITIVANDTVNNVNHTQYFWFRIDRTLPTVSVDCAGPYTLGQEVVCTCTGSDSGSGAMTGPTFITSSTLRFNAESIGSNQATPTPCGVTDFAGNGNGVYGYFTVNEAATSGGSAGGAGGGASSGVVGQSEKKTWSSVLEGETASLITKNGELGITEVSVKVEEAVYGAWIQVAKKESLPSSVESFSGKVYKTLEITKSPTLKSEVTSDFKINFKVDKSWLSEEGLGKGNVALFRYVGGAWTELSTSIAKEDGSYVYYTAATPGLSYFVIGQKTGAALEEPEEEAPVAKEVVKTTTVTEPTPAGEVPAPVGEPELPGAKKPAWAIVLVVLVVLAILAAFYWLKKKK